MSDPYQYAYVNDTSTVHKSGGWGWIIGLIALLILIAAIVFLVLWLVERNKNKQDQEKLELTGSSFRITSDNKMNATWSTVGDSNDQVTLYVERTGSPIKFNASGEPTNSSAVIAKEGPVNGDTIKTLTTSTVLNNGTYTGVLVTTNTGFTGSRQFAGNALTVGSAKPTGAFYIQSTGQPGEIYYEETTSGTTSDYNVGYNYSTTTTASNKIFHHDTNGLICTVNTLNAGGITTTTTCGEVGDTQILYNNNGTLDIKEYSSDSTTDSSAIWVYDENNNKWCLTGGTSGTVNTNCMYIPELQTLTPASSNSDISLASIAVGTGTSNNTWSNVNFTI